MKDHLYERVGERANTWETKFLNDHPCKRSLSWKTTLMREQEKEETHDRPNLWMTNPVGAQSHERHPSFKTTFFYWLLEWSFIRAGVSRFFILLDGDEEAMSDEESVPMSGQGAASTKQSWANRLPPSLMQSKGGSPIKTPTGSPSKSPAKSPGSSSSASDTSPTKVGGPDVVHDTSTTKVFWYDNHCTLFFKLWHLSNQSLLIRDSWTALTPVPARFVDMTFMVFFTSSDTSPTKLCWHDIHGVHLFYRHQSHRALLTQHSWYMPLLTLTSVPPGFVYFSNSQYLSFLTLTPVPVWFVVMKIMVQVNFYLSRFMDVRIMVHVSCYTDTRSIKGLWMWEFWYMSVVLLTPGLWMWEFWYMSFVILTPGPSRFVDVRILVHVSCYTDTKSIKVCWMWHSCNVSILVLTLTPLHHTCPFILFITMIQIEKKEVFPCVCVSVEIC